MILHSLLCTWFIRRTKFAKNKGCIVVLWHNESVNVNPGLSFSAQCSLACKRLLVHLYFKCNVKVQQHNLSLKLKPTYLLKHLFQKFSLRSSSLQISKFLSKRVLFFNNGIVWHSGVAKLEVLKHSISLVSTYMKSTHFCSDHLLLLHSNDIIRM